MDEYYELRQYLKLNYPNVSVTKRVLEGINEKLKEDILYRYHNVDYWDEDLMNDIIDAVIPAAEEPL